MSFLCSIKMCHNEVQYGIYIGNVFSFTIMILFCSHFYAFYLEIVEMSKIVIFKNFNIKTIHYFLRF